MLCKVIACPAFDPTYVPHLHEACKFGVAKTQYDGFASTYTAADMS
jgi:hypothetical protein